MQAETPYTAPWRVRDIRGVPAHTDENGSLHTVEVVIVAMLMTSAVAFVATFDAAPLDAAPVRMTLQQQSEDALAILYDMRLADGSDSLSAFILDCLQGECSNLTRKLDKLLPDGAGYAVYLSHGGTAFPVYEPRQPAGEALTSRHLIEPAWSHTFLAPALSSVDPSEDALSVFALPMYKSTPVSPGGSPLLVRVHGTRVSDGAEYVLTGSYSTQAAATEDAATTPAASLHFVDAAGGPIAYSNVSSLALDGDSGSPTLAELGFRLRLNESAGAAVPADTTLTIHVPPGFYAWADPALNQGTWEILSNSSDYNATFGASQVRARLLAPVSNASIDLVFSATYRGEALDHYPFHAALSRGAWSDATLVVRADQHGSQPRLEVPQVYLTAPKPIGATARTTWALAALVPGGTDGNDALDVTRVEIVESDGAQIFGGVSAIRAGGGNWTTTGSSLVWEGAHRIDHDNPLNLTFHVDANGTAGRSDARAGYVPPVTFDGWTGRILTEVAPGLYRGTFLPAEGGYNGYNGTTGLSVTRTHPLTTPGVYRTTSIPGRATYDVGNFALVEDSLYGNRFALASRYVAPGETLDLSAHLQSALFSAATLGFEANVTLHVHPPWAPDPSTPIHEQTLLDSEGTLGTLLEMLDTDGDGTPGPTTEGIYRVNLPVPQNWLFGTYMLEARLTWEEDVTANLSGQTVSETFTRSASIYDYFVVAPPESLAPVTPLYDVHLVTWMDDWG